MATTARKRAPLTRPAGATAAAARKRRGSPVERGRRASFSSQSGSGPDDDDNDDDDTDSDEDNADSDQLPGNGSDSEGGPARGDSETARATALTNEAEDDERASPPPPSRVQSRVQAARALREEKQRQQQQQQQTESEQPPPDSSNPDAAVGALAVKTDSSRTFADLGVDAWLVAALRALEINRPTAIQRRCIPAAVAGANVIGGSRTGSGKTVAFLAPILHALARDPAGVFALVLTPTRELAFQIYEQALAVSAPADVRTALVTGGADMCAQAIALAGRPHIVVATPGRLADHVRSSGADTVAGLRRCRFLVLDEADRLLAAGPGSMLPDLGTCIDALPPPEQRQTLLFTATVTDEVRALQALPARPGRPPTFFCEVEAGGAAATPPTLRQMYLQVPVTHREHYLHALLSTPRNSAAAAGPGRSAIVFTNRTSTATYLEHLLRLLGHPVTALHSGLPQATRTGNLGRFRAGAARVLVATDVVARGLDIPDVRLVVNYDVPRRPDEYVHRVGRTARAGRRGDSVTLVGQRDVALLLAIEERVGKKMVEYEEEGVNLETRVVKDGLKLVTEAKQEARLRIDEGKDVTGRRVHKHKKQKV